MGFKIENGVLKRYENEEDVADIVIPDGVTSIGERAFWLHFELKSVEFLGKVISIDNCAFEDCRNLKSVMLSDSVKKIGWRAFLGCRSLNSITIPDCIEEISTCAFEECISLKSLTLPFSIRKIGHFAFFKCNNLKSITFKSNELRLDIKVDFYRNSDGITKADAAKLFEFIEIKCAETFEKIKKADYKIPMALLWYFADKNKTAEEYIKKNIKKVILYFAQNNNIDVIYKILSLGFVTKKNVEAIVDLVIETTDNAEIRAIFLNYKHDNFGESDVFKKLEL